VLTTTDPRRFFTRRTRDKLLRENRSPSRDPYELFVTPVWYQPYKKAISAANWGFSDSGKEDCAFHCLLLYCFHYGNQTAKLSRSDCAYPRLVGGKPVIKGTRIPVDMILERLSSDLDLKTLFEDYPDLTEENIKACIAYAKELVEDEEAFPPDEPEPRQAQV
jgi:uncharacterized protein (DUF433 family)